MADNAEEKQDVFTLNCGGDFLKQLNAAMGLMNKRHRKQLLKHNIMNETVLQRIVAFIFGHKYYANIVQVKGLGGSVELTSFIHPTREDAQRHVRDIGETASYAFVETVSFRSRETYVKTVSQDGSRAGQQIK